ncbi:response regulator transcription factor [Anaerolinea thermophila]|uniref:NarL family two-component response regulator n=1 Tax=Anaerolinea thermophila (strain DSM 14523 / JCM 11388 / NBRC 100420 / UNI-1) TaxID=926569 RepID=E8N4B9_ANATU|nr:response regulator transcription factor [Anaerolinea thermophila]BAJ63283.1 NarL family two-component response regulator [Anaerolinea thermophila UNI-1]
MKKIRLLVVDDHVVVRKGLMAILETEPGIEVVGEAGDGNEAVEKACALQPDVVLMDLVMPGMDGIEATRLIKQRVPQVQVLVLTSFSTNDKVIPSLSAGATGYLLKDASPEELVKAIEQVAQGEGALHPAVTRYVLGQIKNMPDEPAPEEELTEREKEVLQFMAQGYSNAEIARLLVVSNATVHTHVSRILSKLNVSSRTQAVLYALKRGIVSLD